MQRQTLAAIPGSPARRCAVRVRAVASRPRSCCARCAGSPGRAIPARATRERATAERAEVAGRLDERIDELGAPRLSGDRQAVAHRLAERHEVGLDARRRDAPQALPRASVARPDLVRHEQSPRAPDGGRRGRDPVVRRAEDPVAREARVDEQRCG
jgi:hypothetical protein